jgi:hypothetical protein
MNEELRKIARNIDSGFLYLLKESQAQTAILGQIRDDLAPEPTRTTTAAIFFGANMAATPGTLAVGATLTATFVPLLADGITVNTTSKLTTNPTWATSDATIASIVSNADGSATVTGVAAGTATITATAGSFTDSDNTVVGPLNATNTVSDTAPVLRTVSAQINFA